MSATEGGDAPGADAPAPPDSEVVITTVVSADDPRPQGDEAEPARTGEAGDAGDDLKWAWDDAAASRSGEQVLAAVEHRLAPLEGLPATVETLGKAIRHELERCAGVLFGHDRALGALANRLDALEKGPRPAPEGEAAAPRAAAVPEEALARALEQVERMAQRLAAMEARVEPLEPLPTVVQALRRAVRAGDELITGETGAREQALAALASELATEAQARDESLRRLVAQDLDRLNGISTAQAKGLNDLAERLATAEGRLGPLESVPEDLAALGRIVRRELDAVVSDNQARDQMLRRALQNEIEQLRASSEAREALASELSTRLEAVETRATEAALANAQAHGTTGGRLEALEARIGALDQLTAELQLVRDTLTKEVEQLRAAADAHDRLAGELTRRLSVLDGRVARLDALPAEVQSLRTAMLQEAERTVWAIRAADERLGQLSWVPGEFQEARKRIIALTSGLQSGQDRMRQLEGAIASTNERLEALRARLTPPSVGP
jgi:chromosome segregation ATPase